MQDSTRHCLALAMTPGLGVTRIHQLLRAFESPGEILSAAPEVLRQWHLPPEVLAYLGSGCALERADAAMEDLNHRGIRVLTPFDPCYPELLREIYDPPLVLYCRGRTEILVRPSVAVVGSRRSTLYGRQVTRQMARGLARSGLTVVSGLARGIDTEAHMGALEGGAATVSVLGNGVDVVYPRENKHLYDRIWESGCLVSEFPCGSFPAPQNFPVRNRIISGLCLGTLITEASQFSGSLITARLTLEQNRLLWAVPGNITSPGSQGPNQLIRQGACLATSHQDVLNELPPYILRLLAIDPPPQERAPALQLTHRERSILELLNADESRHIDHLLERSGLPLADLNETLLQLELKELIIQLPGRRYSRRLT